MNFYQACCSRQLIMIPNFIENKLVEIDTRYISILPINFINHNYPYSCTFKLLDNDSSLLLIDYHIGELCMIFFPEWIIKYGISPYDYNFNIYDFININYLHTNEYFTSYSILKSNSLIQYGLYILYDQSCEKYILRSKSNKINDRLAELIAPSELLRLSEVYNGRTT